jgi:hypothetical protein
MPGGHRRKSRAAPRDDLNAYNDHRRVYRHHGKGDLVGVG